MDGLGRPSTSSGWDGPGLGGASLNYYIGGTPSTLDMNQTGEAIERALDAWSEVADLRFNRISLPNQPNTLNMTFDQIDGPGGILAFARFPNDIENESRIAGDVVFDLAETWEIGNAPARPGVRPGLRRGA